MSKKVMVFVDHDRGAGFPASFEALGAGAALAAQLGLPIRYIGTGEQIDELHPFDAEQFVAALLES